MYFKDLLLNQIVLLWAFILRSFNVNIEVFISVNISYVYMKIFIFLVGKESWYSCLPWGINNVREVIKIGVYNVLPMRQGNIILA